METTTEAEPQGIIQALSALANEHRLAVFRLLVRAGRSGLAAGAIADSLAMPASSLSFHLGQLRTAGLIGQERKHRSLIYRADYRAMDRLVGYLTENCCADEACEPAGECRTQAMET